MNPRATDGTAGRIGAATPKILTPVRSSSRVESLDRECILYGILCIVADAEIEREMNGWMIDGEAIMMVETNVEFENRTHTPLVLR